MECTWQLLVGGGVVAGLISFLTGIFGVGGGFLLAPAMIIVLGVPAPIAVGTDLATICCTSSVGLWQRRGTGTVDAKLALTISAGSLVGVWLGLLILEQLKNLPPLTVLGRTIDQPVNFVLLWVFFLLLVGIAAFLLYDYRRHQGQAPAKRVGLLATWRWGPGLRFASLEEPWLPVLPLVGTGLLTGMLSGLLGIGGGVILLPVLVYLAGQRTVRAAGTSLLLVWVSAALGTVLHFFSGNVHVPLWLAMLAGGTLGTVAGTHVGLRATGPQLRFYFVYVVFAAAALVAAKLAALTLGPVAH